MTKSQRIKGPKKKDLQNIIQKQKIEQHAQHVVPVVLLLSQFLWKVRIIPDQIVMTNEVSFVQIHHTWNNYACFIQRWKYIKDQIPINSFINVVFLLLWTPPPQKTTNKSQLFTTKNMKTLISKTQLASIKCGISSAMNKRRRIINHIKYICTTKIIKTMGNRHRS